MYVEQYKRLMKLLKDLQPLMSSQGFRKVAIELLYSYNNLNNKNNNIKFNRKQLTNQINQSLEHLGVDEATYREIRTLEEKRDGIAYPKK